MPDTYSNQTAQDAKRHEYENGILVGSWTDYASNLVFSDKSVSLTLDVSGSIYFEYDMSVMIDGIEIPPDNVSFDGTTLSVTADASDEDSAIADILTLRRTDGNTDPSDIDGSYEIVSGTMAQQIREGYGAAGDSATMKIDYGDCYVCFDDFCSYTQDEDVLSLSGDGIELLGLDEATAAFIIFTVEDDQLTLYYGDETNITYEKGEI